MNIKFKAAQLQSAPEVLVKEIISKVQEGELEPGMRLPSQRELARMFQVSMGTVREAVQILHVMGYIKVIRGRGSFIADIAKDAIDQDKPDSQLQKALNAVSLAELMKARIMVECGIAREAAQRAEKENIQRLKDVLEKLRQECVNNETFYPVDFEFHLALAEAANNKIIYEIDKLLVDKAHPYIGFMGSSLKTFEQVNIKRSIETAQRIIDAIVAGNGEKASDAMLAHLNIVTSEIEKKYTGSLVDKKGSSSE